jgi:hypothetical protein
MKMEKQKQSTSSIVREINRETCRIFNSEEKIQVVLEGFIRGKLFLQPVTLTSS